MTQIRIVGAMGITEAACIVLSPFVLARMWPKLKKTEGKKILIFLFLWFISAIITDLYRDSSWNDAVRGIFALPFLFAVFIAAFALLWDDLWRVRWMILGMAMSGVISIFYFQAQSLIGRAESIGASAQDIMNFKTQYAGVALLIIGAGVVFLYKRKPLLVVVTQLVASAFYLLQGYRNGFLVLFFSAVGAWLARTRFLSLRKLQKNMVLLVIFTAIGGIIATEIYAAAVRKGWMGEEELYKYEQKSETNIGLLSGRSHFIAAALAIKDSPFLGHGSWAVDKKGYGAKMLEYIGDLDEMRRYYSESCGTDIWIPTHSHLWQAWVWHGFLGGLFWIIVFVLMVRYLKYGLHLCRPLIAYNILIILSSLWDLFFSPFSNRPRWGMVFCIIALTLAEVESRRRAVRAGEQLDVNAPWDGKWSR